MSNLLAFVTQPLIVLFVALALLIGRTILHARRLKTAVKDPDLAQLMSLGEGKDALSLHRDSLNSAKGEPAANLAEARKTMRNYSQDFKRSKQKKT